MTEDRVIGHKSLSSLYVKQSGIEHLTEHNWDAHEHEKRHFIRHRRRTTRFKSAHLFWAAIVIILWISGDVTNRSPIIIRSSIYWG